MTRIGMAFLVEIIIDQHYSQRIALAKRAGLASLSVPQFCAEFKKRTGIERGHSPRYGAK